LARQVPDINCEPGKEAALGSSLETKFTVGTGEHQVFSIEDGMKITLSDSVTRAAEETNVMMRKCASSWKNDETEKGHDEFISCLENKVAAKLYKENYDELLFQTDLNARMSIAVDKYACQNEELVTTRTTNNYQLELSHESDDNEEKTVNALFEYDSVKILVIENFISAEECLNIQKSSGFIDSNANTTRLKHLDQDISSRMYDFATDATGFEWDIDSQDEPLLFRKTQQNQNFVLDPYCDGECQGKMYHPDSRGKVATIVAYCDAPSNSGYSMKFNKAQVYVVPKPGTAVLYSYVGEDFSTDFGFTEYTECASKNDEIVGIKHSFRPLLDQ